VKALVAIFATFSAIAAFGDGTVVRMPKGWTDAVDMAPQSGERRASVGVVPAALRSSVSRDNFIEVFTDEIDPADGVGFKGPIFQSTVDAVGRIADATGFVMPRGGAGLVIHVGNKTNEDTSVVCRVGRNNAGDLVTRIYLPSPGHSDLDDFVRQITAAYLRAWASRTADAAAGEKGAEFKEAPEWVAHGLSRACDEEFSLFDRLDAMSFWQAGEMPFFPNMPSALKFDTDRGSALCGFMVKWMLESRRAAEEQAADGEDRDPKRKETKSRQVTGSTFSEMMGRLAKAKEWDNAAMLQMLTGETDPHAQDAAFDNHMWKMLHSVLKPGKSTPEDVLTFSSRLLLYPPFFDINFPDGRKALPFRLAIRHSSDPVVRVAAFVKQRGLVLTVIGRGERLVKAAESHVRFLQALARGEDKDSLTEKLDEAEALLGSAYKESVEEFGT